MKGVRIDAATVWLAGLALWFLWFLSLAIPPSKADEYGYPDEQWQFEDDGWSVEQDEGDYRIEQGERDGERLHCVEICLDDECEFVRRECNP